MRISKRLDYVALAIWASLLWGCTAHTSPVSALPKLSGAGIIVDEGWLSAEAAKARQLLYAADQKHNVVNVYLLPRFRLVGRIKTGVSGPIGLAVDRHGQLYVANDNAANVTIYPPGKTQPSLTLSDSGNDPFDVAVRNDGTVYVANSNGNVAVYAPGSTTAEYALTDSSLSKVYGVGLDSSNNVYVTGSMLPSFQSEVVKFPPGAGNGTNLHLTGLSAPSGIVLDAANNLVIADAFAPAIDVFPPGATAPSSQFGKAGAPYYLAFNKTKSLVYVGDNASNRIDVYAYPSGGLVKSVSGNRGGVLYGVAVRPAAPN